MKRKERRLRDKKRIDLISTFQQVLRNGFYPDGFIEASTRKSNYRKRNGRKRSKLNNRRIHFKKHRRKHCKKQIPDVFRDRRKYRNCRIKLQRYTNLKRKPNFKMSTVDTFIPMLLTPNRRYSKSQDVHLRDKIVIQPKYSPFISNSERRIGYGGHGGHHGLNSIYVGKDDSGILWPLLGIFGLFQLLTTGAIGKFEID